MSIAIDGLEALREVLSVSEMMSLIERTARWADRETFELLPVWYPEFARGQPAYKGNWSALRNDKPQSNVDATRALTAALGLRAGDRPNWTCCHIWGVDDPRKTNTVVRNACFYSSIANMVLLPSPLKAFTDHVPEVKNMLRLCAKNLFCLKEDDKNLFGGANVPANWADYPASWPKEPGGRPPGVVPINTKIRAAAKKRLKDIRKALKEPGTYYPCEQVKAALEYWDIPITA